MQSLLSPYSWGLLQRDNTWSLSQLPPLTQKVAVVTGGSSGIGAEIIKQLLLHDVAHVYVISRSFSSFTNTLHQVWLPAVIPLSLSSLRERIEFIPCDLADLAQVEETTKKLQKQAERLDILILNAAVPTTPGYRLSPQGIEYSFAANHLGHFQLTTSLLPLLAATPRKHGTPSSRVVVTSSALHMIAGKISYPSLRSPTPAYWPPPLDSILCYCRSKLANILFCRELAHRLRREGEHRVLVNAYYPGNIVTPAMDAWPQLMGPLGWLFRWVVGHMGQSLVDGATTAMFLAGAIETEGITGEYYLPIASRGTPSSTAIDELESMKLWEWCEDIVAQSR